MQTAKSPLNHRLGIGLLLGLLLLAPVANPAWGQAIKEVTIAGAFGSYLDVSSAIEIGMLPPLPLARYRQVGNAAGMGAKLALISLGKRAEARRIASRVNYVELAAMPEFNRTFTQATYLGRYRIKHYERETTH